MTDYQKWLDRVDNLLQVQRDRCLDLISANFTRRELIELKMMIEVLMEKVLAEQESKITSETIQNILDYLVNNNSRWSELRWEDKEGNGFETDQGYFIEGLKGLRDYLKESEGRDENR